MSSIPSWFVIVMGLGTVLVGLVCIILLCTLIGAIFNKVPEKEKALVSELPSAFQNRSEVIAAITAAIAEESGEDIRAIRICSIRKI